MTEETIDDVKQAYALLFKENATLRTAYEQVRQDCHNLTEKVIPNIRAERDKGAADMLEKLIDVWDDGQLPHEHRCYVDGAWSELIAEARALIAAAPTEAKPAQQDAVDAQRYRWLREGHEGCYDRVMIHAGESLDRAVDAARAAQQATGQKGGV